MKKLKTFTSAATLALAGGFAHAQVVDIQVDIFAQDTNAIADQIGLPQGATPGSLVDGTPSGAANTRTVGGTLNTVTGAVEIAGVSGWVDNYQAVTNFDDIGTLGASYSSSGGGVVGPGLLNVTGWAVDGGTSYCTQLDGTICNYLGAGTTGTGTGTLPAEPLGVTGLWVFDDNFNVGSTASVTVTDTSNGRNATDRITFTVLASPLLPPAPPPPPSGGPAGPVNINIPTMPFYGLLATGFGLAWLAGRRLRKQGRGKKR